MKLPPDKRLLVIIPAYNEQDSLAQVISSVFDAVPEADVVVVNDGSRDDTAKVAASVGARVINLTYNLGIGAAVQTGFILAAEEHYDYAVQVDGDGQHDPYEMRVILEPLLADMADVVIGSRYIEERGYVTPWQRRTGIKILAGFVSLLARQCYTDTTSGFRASNRRAIELCAQHYPADYPEPESLMTFRKMGLQVIEVPASMNPRYAGRSSITPFWSGYYMIKVMLAVSILFLRRAPYLRDGQHVS